MKTIYPETMSLFLWYNRANAMALTLSKKNGGIKIAWFFMIITIGAFFADLRGAQRTLNKGGVSSDTGYELGYTAGGKLGLATFLGIGMILYSRTKKRKFGHSVWGPKFIDYFLAFILAINFLNLLITGNFAYGTGDDVLAFFYITSSLLAYAYALLAKPKISSEIGSTIKSTEDSPQDTV